MTLHREFASPEAPRNGTEARRWPAILARYRRPHHGRSFLELAITVLPLAALGIAMYAAFKISYLLCLLLSVPAAGLLVRLFMIQHDCGHGAFFRNRHLNDWVGRCLGVITLTPYDYWRQTHSIHHASSGNLQQRGVGDIDTLTLREFQMLPRWRRIAYRLYRNPAVMFGLGPIYVFVFRNRLPFGLMHQGPVPWISTQATNAGIAALVLALLAVTGSPSFLAIYFPTIAIAAAIGVWLFYVQHQFDSTSWAHADEWNHASAALHGSSYYDLPPVLRWFTANIGIHHVHHLCSKVPFYRLPRVLRDYPELSAIGRITLWQSLRCVPLALWDESRQKLISFRELRRRERNRSSCRSLA